MKKAKRMLVYYLLYLGAAISVITSCSTDNGIITNLSIRSVRYLNPDIYGKASPIVLSIYELNSSYQFQHASYIQLKNNAANTLGNNLIDRHVLEIQPGMINKKQFFLDPDTRYIGITAAYRNIDLAKWKQILVIPNKKHKIKLIINLESQSLRATIKKARGFL